MRLTWKKLVVLIVIVPTLAVSGWWLVLGYGTYQDVRAFDGDGTACIRSCMACADVGRPRAFWPYSMFTGPDPRLREVAPEDCPVYE